MSKFNGRVLRQKGFASIVVSLILVVVLSLITVGFVQLSRREQQNSLNQQLATQANYAAESAINKVVSDLKTPGNTVTSNNRCNASPAAYTTNLLNGSYSASVSCVLINTSPTTTQYGGVAPNSGKITYFTTGAPVNSIDFSWASGNASNNSNNAKFFASLLAPNPSSASWNRPAVIQLSITPLSNYNRSQMLSNTYNYFLYPGSAGVTSINTNSVLSNSKVLVKCDSTKLSPDTCKVTINTSATGLLSAQEYMVHFVSLYDSSDVKLVANGVVGGASQALQLQGSQTEIDVTARSQDVVKRVRVRVTVSSSVSSDVPDYVLQATNICKRIKTSPTGGSQYFDTGGGVASNSACDGASALPINPQDVPQ